MNNIRDEGMDENLIVYSANLCDHCMKLKEFLHQNHIHFTEEDISTAESLTELRMNGCFCIEAPILRIGNLFLTDKDLFQEEKIREDLAGRLLQFTRREEEL